MCVHVCAALVATPDYSLPTASVQPHYSRTTASIQPQYSLSADLDCSVCIMLFSQRKGGKGSTEYTVGQHRRSGSSSYNFHISHCDHGHCHSFHKSIKRSSTSSESSVLPTMTAVTSSDILVAHSKDYWGRGFFSV